PGPRTRWSSGEPLTCGRPYRTFTIRSGTSETDYCAWRHGTTTSREESTMADGTEPTTTLARIEDPALLTGRGRFLDDLDPLPGTLAAAVVRSPHPHARIREVHLDRARNHPGVAAVIGPEEVLATLNPFPLSLRTPMPYYPTGTDKVRFVGEPV